MIKIVAVAAAVTFALATAGCAARNSSGAVARTAMCERPTTTTFASCRAQFQPDTLTPSAGVALPQHASLTTTHESRTHVTIEPMKSTFRATNPHGPAVSPPRPL
jgi:hypothetical protein